MDVSGTSAPPRRFKWSVDAAVELLLRPESFFRFYLKARPNAFPQLAIWIVGMAAVLDRLGSDFLIARWPEGWGSPEYTTTNWMFFWGMVMVWGLIAGALSWLVMGWWYRMRLRFSGARSPEPRKARLVFIHARLVWAVTALALVLLEMPLRGNYAELARSETIALAHIVMPFWAIFIGYRGAIACFDVRRGPARLWFAIFPAAILAAFILISTIALWNS